MRVLLTMKWSALLLVFVFLVPLSLAHGDETQGVKPALLGAEALKAQTGLLIGIVSVLVVVLVIIAILIGDEKSERGKWVLFLALAIPIVLVTLYSAGTTIYLNVVSETKGPVHWHADFEIWNCGESVNLIDPTGLTNRVGTPILHEHNDNRLHVEGVLLYKDEANLHNFFEVTGGEIIGDRLSVPTDEGDVVLESGATCDGEVGELQYFVYRVVNSSASQNDNFFYEQLKVDDEYILSPYINVPPGDCIIVELDKPKERTERICETFRIAIAQGRMSEVGS